MTDDLSDSRSPRKYDFSFEGIKRGCSGTDEKRGTVWDPNRKLVVGVSGIIGAGKTRFATEMSKILRCDLSLEPVEDNPYLASFYEDMEKYAFPMQIYLLSERFRQHQRSLWNPISVVQDRTIYEDIIFARMLQSTGMISQLDFGTYASLFSDMCNFLRRPDVVVFLSVKPKTALERVKQRARRMEGSMSEKYMEDLWEEYGYWARAFSAWVPVCVVEWDDNIPTQEEYEGLVADVANYISLRVAGEPPGLYHYAKSQSTELPK